MKTYFAPDWYWVASDGRTYGSARQALVLEEADEAFLAWRADGTEPQRWPADDAGKQTTASLQAVLAPYGLFADLREYASQVQNKTMAKVWSFNVAGNDAPAHTVTTNLDAGGQFAMLKVLAWGQMNASVPDAVLPYSNVDFSETTLTPAEAASLGSQAGVIDAKGYALLNRMVAGIMATPPTITTAAQIDAAFAALA